MLERLNAEIGILQQSHQLKTSNVYSTPEPWSLVSNGYEQTTMRFLSQYSKSAIQLSNINPNSDVLDMACGPGTLSRLLDKKVKSITALDFSSKMINLFDNYIQTKQIKNIKTVLGDGQNLFFEDNSFDTIFSMFGLMFFPNRLKGFTECFRVLKPKGQIIVSSWAPVDQSPAMQLMFGAMKAAKPDLPKPEKDMRSLESEKIFKKELEYAGFSNISIHLITHNIELESPKSFWNEMTKGSAPIAMLRKNVDNKTWLSMEKIALDYIKNSISNFPTVLSSDAWIGVADKETSI